MKLGLLTSYRAQKEYPAEHEAIVKAMKARGHEVIHSLDTKVDDLLKLPFSEREKIFLAFYQQLEDCELIFVECSIQSTQVGFGLAYLKAKGKPLVLLSIKNVDTSIPIHEEVYSNVENVMVSEYTKETIGEILDDALNYMEPNIDKRFTVIFPAQLLSRIEEVARKKKLPKAAYIRQLIEKDLETKKDK